MLSRIREFNEQYGRVWAAIFGLFFILGMLCTFATFSYTVALNLDYVEDDYEELNGDWRIFADAAQNLANNEPIYETGISLNYRYAPSFALFLGVFTNPLPLRTHALIWFFINVGLYVGVAIAWYRALGLRTSLLTMSLYVLGSLWNSDLQALWYYGNITTLLMFMAAYVVIWLKEEKYIWAGVFTGFIFLTKPHWAFPIIFALLILNPQSRSLWTSFQTFLKSKYLGAMIGTYITTMLIFVVVKGPTHGLDYIKEYFKVLFDISTNYIYSDQGALSTEHGLQNTLHRLFGYPSWIEPVTWLLKLTFGLSFVWIINRVIKTGKQLELAPLVLVGSYLTTMFIIPQMQELIFAPVVFYVIWYFGTISSRIIIFPTLIYLMHSLPAFIILIAELDIPILAEVLPISFMSLLVYYGVLLYEINRLTIVKADIAT